MLMSMTTLTATKSAVSINRMPKPAQLFVTDKTAAHMLDMSKNVFLDLVDHGALPRAIPIGPKMQRWSVEDLKAIQSGEIHEEPIW